MTLRLDHKKHIFFVVAAAIAIFISFADASVPCNSETNTICLNGATCDNTTGVYTCVCMIGWTGAICDTMFIPDPCISGPCQHGGSCTTWPNNVKYTCTCTAAWTDTKCQTAKPLPLVSGFDVDYVEMVSPTGVPDVVAVVPTALDCGRWCLSNSQCKGYVVDRHVRPTQGVNCRIYYVISGYQPDASATTYTAGGNLLPTQ